MRVSTLINYVARGDLKQTALGLIGSDPDNRTAQEQENVDTIVDFVNQGILELHKRFPILVKVEEFRLKRPSTVDDAVELPNSAIELAKVVDSKGERVPVDDYHVEREYEEGAFDKFYVKSLSVNSFLVLGNVPETGVDVYFHCKTAPSEVRYSSNVPLPVIYEEALRNYVCSRGFSTVEGALQEGDKGLIYRNKFEDNCKQIEKNTHTFYEWSYPQRFYERTFV